MKIGRSLRVLFTLALSIGILLPRISHATEATAKVKRIHFVIRNDREQDIQVRFGVETKVIAPKQEMKFDLPEGETVVSAQAPGTYQQGEILVRVTRILDGNTVAIH